MLLAEARNWTPEQCRRITLYQYKCMALGAEFLRKYAKEQAIEKQPPAIRDKAKRILGWYKAHGLDAR